MALTPPPGECTVANHSSEAKRNSPPTISLLSRLKSIIEDANFVKKIASCYELPLVANERAGRWYIPPGSDAPSAYFKSMDGHHGQWAFSRRRLNVELFGMIGDAGGCIIVDSSRRKIMPDALSKTVPIWCSVFNRMLFPEADPVLHQVQTPAVAAVVVVSADESRQVNARLDQFTLEAQALDLDIPTLRRRLQRPLKPVFVTPDSPPPSSCSVASTSLNAVICVSASRHTRTDSTSTYIPGAADDSENWAHGLTPTLFQTHRETVLQAASLSIPDFQATLAQLNCKTCPAVQSAPKRITGTNIWIGTTHRLAATHPVSGYECIIICGAACPDLLPPPPPPTNRVKIITISVGPGKLGSRRLRTELPNALACMELLHRQSHQHPNVLITCATGTDISVGVALLIMCRFYEDGKVDKTVVKRWLAKIMVAMPEAKPSRTTLNSVNDVLMKGRSAPVGE